jgi:hypothetical protein
LAQPNWSRPLPRLLKIPGVTTLATLADVRELVEHHLASECWEPEWHRVINRLHEAARGDDMTNLMVSLRLVLELEQIPCLTP